MREAHLRDFIAVIETGSVRAAAKRLNLTQGAVSRNLTALERSFGVSLLLRSAHGVEPTECGRAVLRHARVVDSELRKMQDEINALSGGRVATVAVGLSSSAEALLLATATEQMHKQLPNTLLSTVSGPPATLLSGLRESRVDLAICPMPESLDGSDLTKERLFSTNLVIVARREHPAAESTDIADLQPYGWVLSTRTVDAEPLVAGMLRERQLPPPAYVVQRDSSSSLLHVLLGTDLLAVATVPTVEQFCRCGLLTVLPIDVNFPPVIAYLVTSASRPLTVAAGVVAAEFRKASRRYRR